jgi:cell division protein FtsW
VTINGAHRWIGLGGITFQPSECAKILIPLAFIRWVLLQKESISWKVFLKMLAPLSIPLGLILLEPDNGTTAVVLALLVILFILTRIRARYWALPLLILIGVGALVASRMPHVPDRIRVYLHPELDLRGKGHQPHQAKIAAGSGGLFGRGLGESLQKLNYLPEARSDYIAAIYAEEFGFIGIVGLIGLYLSFAYAGFLIAMRAEEPGGFLLASTLTFLIALQAFLNLGIVSGLLPSKGMTLPFFSAGGSSLIVNITALFLLLDISRHPKRLTS